MISLGYIQPPESILSLEQFDTHQFLEEQKEHPEIQVVYTKGAGVHHGKTYAHVTIQCPVERKGRIYLGAKSKPVSLSNKRKKIEFHLMSVHPYQEYKERQQRWDCLPYSVQLRVEELVTYFSRDLSFSPDLLVKIGEVMAGTRSRIEDATFTRVCIEKFGIRNWGELASVIIPKPGDLKQKALPVSLLFNEEGQMQLIF